MSVCKDCPDRALTCHDVCERYRAEKEERDKRRRKISEAKTIEYITRDTFYDGIERMKKRRKSHGSR